jgi:hypothetical protein
MDDTQVYLWEKILDAHVKIRTLKRMNEIITIDLNNQRKYGTDNKNKIAKILKAEKAKQEKEFKQKVIAQSDILKKAIKAGDKYVAVLMDYKKRKFNGYHIETRIDKPKSKIYFNLNKDSVKEIAETLVKKYEQGTTN